MNRFCTSCGAALEEGARFCGECGTPAQASAPAQADEPTQADAAQADTTAQAVPPAQSAAVNKEAEAAEEKSLNLPALDTKQLKEKANGFFAKLPFRAMAEKIPAGTRAKFPLLDKAIPFANQIACGLAAVLVVAVIAGSGGGKNPEKLQKQLLSLENEMAEAQIGEVYDTAKMAKLTGDAVKLARELQKAGVYNAEEVAEWEEAADYWAAEAGTGQQTAVTAGGKPNAESDFNVGSGKGGSISGYSGAGKKVVIPAEIGGEPVTLIEADAFAGNGNITSVVIPEGVTVIGRFAFANCAALKSVTLPASLKEIGDGAFMHCAGLTTVANLPAPVDAEGLPVLKRLGDFAFGGCEKLDSKTRAVLAELGVTDFALGKPAISGGASSITPAAHYNPNQRIAVPYASILSWLGMSYNIVARNLFASYALTSGEDTQARLLGAQVSGSTFSGVIGRFKGDQKQMELTINVKSGADGSNYLAYVKLQNTEGSTIEGRWDDIPEIEGMDESAGEAIGKAVATLFVPITEHGFYDVRRLAVNLNPGVQSPAALAGVRNQITPEDEFTVGLTASNDGAVIKKHTNSEREYVNIPETIQGIPVREIDSRAFQDRGGLVSVTIPEGVTRIGDSAFSGCNSLVSVTIPGSVKTIGSRVFSGCNNLESVDIPEGVTVIGDNTFYKCYNLASVVIPNSVKTIGEYAFWDCDSLTAVVIPGSVTAIGREAFRSCNSLESVTIPGSVKTIGNSAFRGCGRLAAVAIPEGVTAIGEYAFYECKNLASVAIPDSVKTIGTEAFRNCDNLITAAISPVKRGFSYNDAFENCPKLSLASQAALKAAGYTGGF